MFASYKNEGLRLTGVKRTGPLVLATLILGGLWSGDSAWAHHVEVPRGDGHQFLWPTTTWLSSNHLRVDGVTHHSGTADLSAPYYTPVYAARQGTVVSTGFFGISGWYVRIRHETIGDAQYQTSYQHLVREPEVVPNQTVAAGELVGFIGRTGNSATAHLHFQIYQYKDGGRTPMRIPPEDASIGDWTKAGTYIPGVYDPGLSPIPVQSVDVFDVRVIEPAGLWMYASTSRNASDRLLQLSEGDEASVVDSHRGQYYVFLDSGESGWVPSSGVVPLANEMFGVRVNGGMNIRRSPSASSDQIGWITSGWLLAGFETSGSWSRVRWKCTATSNRSTDSADNTSELGGCPNRQPGDTVVTWKYGWIGSANTVRTDNLRAKIMYDNLRVYANRVVNGESRPDLGVVIDRLPSHYVIPATTGRRNGWYRFVHNGQTAWIRGWFTTTRT